MEPNLTVSRYQAGSFSEKQENVMHWQARLTKTEECIRQYPHNSDLRLEMVQYLCILGDWERALKQLAQFQKIFDRQDQALVLYLINQIEAELRRNAVLRTDYKPLTFEQDALSNRILEQQLTMLVWLAEHDYHKLDATYHELVECVPEITATIQVKSLENSLHVTEPWLMDGDLRTAFVCELLVNGQYYWQPWHTIRSIQFQEPKVLPDMLWRNAQIILQNGKQFSASVPARYGFLPHISYDDTLIAGARTIWHPTVHGDLYLGCGQKMLYGKQEEYALLDIEILMFS